MEEAPPDDGGPSDSQLLQRILESTAADGRRDAFWELWQRHDSWIRSRIRRLARLAPSHCPRDVFREAVLDRARDNLLRGLHQFAGRGELRAFIATIVQRAAIDEYRYQKRRPLLPLVDEPDGEVLEDSQTTYRSPSLLPSPARLALSHDRALKLRLVLAMVAADSNKGLKCALALRRRFLEGRSLGEIASEMGVVEHTVWLWIKEGLRRAAEVLGDQFNVNRVGDL